MRWSISTKIFAGFGVMILTFMAFGAYGVHRLHVMRREVRFYSLALVPAIDQMIQLSEKLEAASSKLERPPQWDQRRLSDTVSGFKPYTRLRRIGGLLERRVVQLQIPAAERHSLDQLIRSISREVTGDTLKTTLENHRDMDDILTTVLQRSKDSSNEQAWYALASTYVRMLHEESFSEAYVLQRFLKRETQALADRVHQHRYALSALVRSGGRRLERLEAQATLLVAAGAAVALLASLGVMIWMGLILRPLSRLREGVRAVAAGDFQVVDVKTDDEIGLLADEFNRMALSLTERDRVVARQAEELVRSDRLATIGKMSSQVTHEIRNPLSSMGLNAELLEDELRDLRMEDNGDQVDEAQALLLAIRGEIDRLTAVTDQYLRLARLPQPRLEEEDLNGLLTDILAFMEGELAGHDIHLDKRLSDAVGRVRIDRNQMRQVVLNLVRNAVEAMPDGGDLIVETERSGAEIRLTLADTGPGISPEVAARLFEPFFSTKATGTGLGLPLVLEIVQNHGGSMRLVTERAVGAEFLIILPRDGQSAVVRELAEAARAQADGAAAAKAEGEGEGEGEKGGLLRRGDYLNESETTKGPAA